MPSAMSATAAPSIAELDELSRLRAELAALRKSKEPKVSLKVSEKGGISIYGLRRFPITLYRRELEAVLSRSEEIHAFIDANSARLNTKTE